jgi:hypothetical protein
MKLPLKRQPYPASTDSHIVDADGKEICRISPDTCELAHGAVVAFPDKVAEQIVDAVNTHTVRNEPTGNNLNEEWLIIDPPANPEAIRPTEIVGRSSGAQVGRAASLKDARMIVTVHNMAMQGVNELAELATDKVEEFKDHIDVAQLQRDVEFLDRHNKNKALLLETIELAVEQATGKPRSGRIVADILALGESAKKGTDQ